MKDLYNLEYALANLRSAFSKCGDAVESLDEELADELVRKHYPFKNSFSEAVEDIISWTNCCLEQIALYEGKVDLQYYKKRMRLFVDILRLKWSDEVYEEMCAFQLSYMEGVERKLRAGADSAEKQKVCDILLEVITHSQTGSVVTYYDDEKEAKDVVNQLLVGDVREYLLDFPQVYHAEGGWAVDCMFGGYFVPEWDGFKEGGIAV